MRNDELQVIQEDDSDAWQCQLALEARQREPAPDVRQVIVLLKRLLRWHRLSDGQSNDI